MFLVRSLYKLSTFLNQKVGNWLIYIKCFDQFQTVFHSKLNWKFPFHSTVFVITPDCGLTQVRQYCSALLHLIAGWFGLNNFVQHFTPDRGLIWAQYFSALLHLIAGWFGLNKIFQHCYTWSRADSGSTIFFSIVTPDCGLIQAQQYCSALLHLIAGWFGLNNIVQHCYTWLQADSGSTILFSIVTPDCGLIQAQQHCSALLTPDRGLIQRLNNIV